MHNAWAMGRSSTFPLHDQAFDGHLAGTLTRWRSEGLTFEDIAYRLRSEHEIKVSASTVQRWLAGPETVTEAAS